MELITAGYLGAVLFTLVSMLYLARFAWLRRDVPGARTLSLAMLAIVEVAASFLLLTVASNTDLAFFAARLRFVGLASAPPLLFSFIFEYTNRSAWVRPLRRWLVIVPLVTVLVLWLAPNQLFFQGWHLVRIGAGTMESSRFDGWYWVYFPYNTVLMVAGIGWLAYYLLRIDKSLLYGGRWILVGMIIGMIGTLPTATIGPAPGFRLSPIGLGITAICFALALFRYHLLDTRPIAYDAVFMGIRDAVIVLDEYDKVAQINPGAERLLGQKQADVAGKPITVVLVTPPDVARHYLHNLRARDAQLSFSYERGQHGFFLEVHISPVYQRHRLVGRIMVLYDVTERRQAEDRLSQTVEIIDNQNQALRTLHDIALDINADLKLDNLPQRIVERAVILLEADRGGGLYLYDSERNALRMVAGSGINAQRIGVMLPTTEGITGQVFQTGKPLIVNDYTHWPHRALTIVSDPPSAVMMVPLHGQGNKVIGVLGVIANSALRKYGEQDVQLAEMLASYANVALQNTDLYDRAQQEIAQRKQIEQERETLIEELNAFTHTVAHDLKDPVSVIIGYQTLLSMTLKDLPNAKVQRDLKAIERTGWKMIAIINELLVFSSVRQLEQVPLAPLPMGDLVSEALARLQFMIAEKHAVISAKEMDTWPIAAGYAPWVEEVWTNYLSNAIKYGGTPPQIELGAALEANGQVRFWVRDNGAGLSPEQAARLFQIYNRLDQVRIDGHGLGLSIVKKIITKLGGTVGVISEPGTGSTFSFSLPAFHEAQPEAPPPIAVEP